MDRDNYVQLMRDLLSGNPQRIRDANRQLYSTTVVDEPGKLQDTASDREADLVLAEVAG